MITPSEYKAIQLYYLSDPRDKSILTEQARLDNPSPEFQDYLLRLLERVPTLSEKSVLKERRAIAILIEMMDFPKNNHEEQNNIFKLLAPFFNKSPSTIQKYYYAHKEEAEFFANVVKQYQANHESIPQTLIPAVMILIEDAEMYTEYFKNKT